MTTRRKLANAIRFLAIDAVQKANSGHPGMPMGMADIAEVLWNDFLKHDPNNPKWWNRDRFVLSNGHGSMLQYALLHLSGYDLSISDIKSFRQLRSKTPGHPEIGVTPGVEVTTGPLGQGLGCAVGMALAEQLLANKFNKPNYPIINHHTYCFLGDGCLMEGISHEVCSLAGTLGLSKLICFWDNNNISIDGEVTGWFSEDVALRFKSYGWQVIDKIDGHDPENIKQAISQALKNNTQPSLLCCKTTIGFGSPNLSGNAKTHGQALGAEEVQATREQLKWPHEEFVIPEEIYNAWDAKSKGQKLTDNWQNIFNNYQRDYNNLAEELTRRMQKELPVDLDDNLNKFISNLQQNNINKNNINNLATRKSSQIVLDLLGEYLPELIGGSADLTGSNLTKHKNSQAILPNKLAGNYIYYGVREFGMSVIMNGLALHGGFIPYGGTFLTFADYARNAIRMSAIMKQKVIYVLTHDSIGLGEDGPTHQPTEHLTMLRATPNVSVWRPCDTVETAVAWQQALKNSTGSIFGSSSGPSCLILSRQKLKDQQRNIQQINNISRGGYILNADLPEETTAEKIIPEAIIIATGSEVQIALDAQKDLIKQGHRVRLVSMPNSKIFLEQDLEYQEKVLPKAVTVRVAVEAGASAGWYQFVGLNGKVIGVDRFGESAPADEVFIDMGLTADIIKQAVMSKLIEL